MAYPGIALVAMVGVGLGLALWYLLTDTTNESPHGNGPPPPRRDSPPLISSWDLPNDTRRRRTRNNSRAKDDCSICAEPLEDLAVTVKCGHIFHRECIQKWRETIRSQGGDHGSMVTCPLCRQTI